MRNALKRKMSRDQFIEKEIVKRFVLQICNISRVRSYRTKSAYFAVVWTINWGTSTQTLGHMKANGSNNGSFFLERVHRSTVAP